MFGLVFGAADDGLFDRRFGKVDEFEGFVEGFIRKGSGAMCGAWIGVEKTGGDAGGAGTDAFLII